MGDGDDDDLLFADAIDDTVRKAPKHELPQLRSRRRVLFDREARRASKNLGDAEFKLLEEFISKTVVAVFVPLCNFGDLAPRTRKE